MRMLDTITELQARAPKWARCSLVCVDSDEWEVRLNARAFDYMGAMHVKRDDSRENVYAQFDGLVEQMRETILEGRAPFAHGYPKPFV